MTKRGKRRLLILCVVALFGVAGVFGLRAFRDIQAEKRAVRDRAEGMALYQARDYEEALQPLSRAIPRMKEDVEMLMAFADARSRVPVASGRHIAEASEYYRRVMVIDRDNIAAMEGRVNTLQRLGDMAELLSAAGRLTREEPENIVGWRGLAMAAMNFTNEDEVIASVERSLGDDAKVTVMPRVPSPDQRPEEVSRFDAAWAVSRKLIELEPDDLSWRVLGLEAAARKGRSIPDRLLMVDQWIADGETDGRYRAIRAELLSLDPATPPVLINDELEEAAKLGASSPEVLEALLRQLDLFGLEAEADGLLETVRARHVGEVWVSVAGLRRAWLDGDYSLAETEYENAPKESIPATESARLATWRVVLDLATADIESATASLDVMRSRLAALDVDNRRPDLEQLGEALAMGIDPGDASYRQRIRTMESAGRMPSDDPALNALPWLLAASLYDRSGALSDAERCLRVAQRSAGQSTIINSKLARVMLDLGRPRDAINMLEMLRDRAPNVTLPMLAEAWVQVGPAARTGVRSNWVQRLLEEIIVDRGEWGLGVTQLLADFYTQERLSDELRAMAELAMASEDATAPALLSISDSARKLDFADLQTRLLDTAMERVDPATPEGARAAAVITHTRGDVESAIRELDAAAEAIIAGTMDVEIDEADLGVNVAFVRGEDRSTWPEVVSMRWRAAQWAAQIDADDAAERTEAVAPLVANVSSLRSFLSSASAWRDDRVAIAVRDRLEEILGEDAGAVRLAKARMLTANGANDRQALSEGITLIEALVDEYPADRDILMTHARVLTDHVPERWQQAVDSLEDVVALRPDDMEATMMLLRILHGKADWERATTYADNAAMAAGRDPRVRRNIARIFLDQGRPERAIELLERVADQRTVPEDRMLATAYRRTGQFDRAKRVVENRIAGGEATMAMVLDEAQQRFIEDGRDSAIALLDRGLADLPAADRTWAMAFFMIDVLKDDAAARPYIDEALTVNPDDQRVQVVRTQYLLLRGDVEQAREEAIEMLNRNPNNAGLARLLSTFVDQASLDANPKVAAVVEPLLRDGTIVEGLKRLIGLQNPTDSDLQLAVTIARDNPRNVKALEVAVHLLESNGQPERAMELARIAFDRMPSQATPARLLAGLFDRAGRVDDAILFGRRWHDRSLVNPIDADFFLAMVELRRGNPSTARQLVESYEDRITKDLSQVENRGRVGAWLRILVATGQTSSAVTLATRMLESVSGEEARSAMANVVLDAVGDANPLDARNYLNRMEAALVSADVPADRVAEGWAWSAARTGDAALLNEARTRIRAIAPDPSASDLDRQKAGNRIVNAARWMDDSELAQEAVRVLEPLLTKPEVESLTYGLVAQAAELAGDNTLAENAYKSVLRQEPAAIAALNNITNVIAKDPSRLDEALGYARDAHSLAEATGNAVIPARILETMSRVQFAKGDYEDAEASLRSALQAVPNYATVHAGLGRVLAARREWNQARASIENAERRLSLIPAPDEKRDVQSIIDEAKALISAR